MRQHHQLLVSDDGTTQLQISVELGGVVALEDGLDGRKEPWAILHQRREDKLEAGGIEARHSEKRLAVAAQLRVHLLDVHRRDAPEAYAEVGSCRLRGSPDQSQVRDDQDATLAVVSLGVLHGIDGIDLNLTFPQAECRGRLIELDLAVLPHLLEDVLPRRHGRRRFRPPSLRLRPPRPRRPPSPPSLARGREGGCARPHEAGRRRGGGGARSAGPS
mmetsp:Transcript_174741/g.560485  ORF Transcript_174741/g.560485 Transcript_174741/m.560485 type:complete len:217 (+) Transcript_174741:290-940(+)